MCDAVGRTSGMSIHTDRRAGYEAGEEVHITYGHHPNAFLAVEYGFVLAGTDTRV